MLSVAVALLATATCMWAQPTEDERVEELLQKMTLQEKIGQLNQLSVGGFDHNAAGMMRAGMVGSILNECNPNVLNRYQRAAVEESRLGIPLLISRDVIHGFKTMFPIPLGLAATFDPELVQQGARFAAIEATANGVRWTFSPMLDIARDPRWGRIAEGSGEDTYLDTQMGVAMVKGYQGETIDQTSMAACVKHFVAYGAAEGGRDYNSTGVSERTLRNVYLPPFEACVEAGVMTLMTSFNDNDGIPSTGNGFLVNDVLRGEWGFKGFVVSDWASIHEMVNHGYAEDNKHAGELAFNAGVDMDMMSFSYISHLEELINEGKVSMETVDKAVRSILRVKFRLGLFENPYIDEPNVEAAFYSEEALEAARKSAVESAVLLTNNGVLPLNRAKVKTVLVTGPMADAPHDQLGTWTFDGDAAHTVTPLMAIKELYGNDVNVNFACEFGELFSEGEHLFLRAFACIREAFEVHRIEANTAFGDHKAGNGAIDTAGKKKKALAVGADGHTACTGGGLCVNISSIVTDFHMNDQVGVANVNGNVGDDDCGDIKRKVLKTRNKRLYEACINKQCLVIVFKSHPGQRKSAALEVVDSVKAKVN